MRTSRHPFFVWTGVQRPASTERPVHATATASWPVASSPWWWWFNASAVLHDVRPSARYTRRQTSSSPDAVHASVTVDGRRFDGVGATWRAAKRRAAADALRHILQLRHLVSRF